MREETKSCRIVFRCKYCIKPSFTSNCHSEDCIGIFINKEIY